VPPAAQIVIGLLAGLGVGVAMAGWPAGQWFVRTVEPIGTLFVNAIRMTVIPLVVAKLIVGVAGTSDERALRRLGFGAAALFFVTLFVAAAFAAVAGWPALAGLEIHPGIAAELRSTAAGASATASADIERVPGFWAWLVSLVPPNPIAAGAEGAMLPIIVFSLALGAALTRVEAERRRVALQLFSAIGDAMVVLIRWVLLAAPIGVFALAVPLAARLGVAAAGALAYYIGLVALCCTVFTVLVIYPAAVFLGRTPLRAFARAAGPVQAVAMSSRSSLATLPVVIEEARDRLKLSDEITGFFLPFAAVLFRAGSVMGTTIGALFIARLYGVPLDTTQMAAVVATAVFATFGTPGMPSGSILVIVPVLLAARVPVEGFGVLLGVDTIPDMFRTTTNQTANLAAAAILDRWIRRSPHPVPGVLSA
jgi:Na+/H+-dicarboxylate symporter